MIEPGLGASDTELAVYYEDHHDLSEWGDPQAIQRAERLEVTISVRFTPAEIAAVRTRAEAAGLKATTYIRRCALAADKAPIDRGQLSLSVAALSRDLDNLRRAAGD